MNSLTHEFIKLLNLNAGMIYSDHEVEISFELDEGIHLATPFPGYATKDENVSLDLTLFYPSLTDFFDAFALTHIGDVEEITPAALLKRFQQGEAQVFCSIDGFLNHYLYFHKGEGKLYAINELDIQYTIPHDLTTPEELVQYTKTYFFSQLN